MQSFDGHQPRAEQAAALVELGRHGVHAVAGRFDGGQGAELGKTANVARALALQGTGGGHHRLGAGQPAKAPAGHGPALGEAIDRKDAIGQVWSHGGKAVVGVAWGQQEFIDLIAHHGHLGMAAQHVGNRLELRPAQHHASGIAGAVEHKQLAGWSDGCLQLGRIEAEALGRRAGQHGHRGSGELGDLWIAEPVRRRQQQLVAGLQQHLEQVVERLLAAVGDQHLLGGGGYAVFSAELGGYCIAQGRLAGGWAVAGVACLQSSGGGLADEGRGVEIRFAGAEAADVLTISFEGLGSGGNGQGEGGLEGPGPGREGRSGGGRGGHPCVRHQDARHQHWLASCLTDLPRTVQRGTKWPASYTLMVLP